MGQGPGWSHLNQIFLCGRLCLTSGLWAGSYHELSSGKGLRERPWATERPTPASAALLPSAVIARRQVTFPKDGHSCLHFYQNVSMSWHQTTPFLAEMSSAKKEQLALQRCHFCCMQRPRLKSCRDKTSLTFQTLPRKNTNDSKAWGWRRGVGGKGNERRATTRKILCSWKWNFMMLGLPLTAQGLTQHTLIKY